MNMKIFFLNEESCDILLGNDVDDLEKVYKLFQVVQQQVKTLTEQQKTLVMQLKMLSDSTLELKNKVDVLEKRSKLKVVKD